MEYKQEVLEYPDLYDKARQLWPGASEKLLSVAVLRGAGYSQTEIAGMMGINRRTVERYMDRLRASCVHPDHSEKAPQSCLLSSYPFRV